LGTGEALAQGLALKDAMKSQAKRRCILAGALILLVVVLARLAFMYMTSRPRFRFLQGQEPAIAMGFSGGSPAYNGGVSEMYSFPADFNSVYPDIRAELKLLGFGESRRYRRNNPKHYFQDSARDRCFVRVLHDRKLTTQSTPAQLLYEPKQGYPFGKPEKSFEGSKKTELRPRLNGEDQSSVAGDMCPVGSIS
jgi:hypothetical protein